MYTMQNRLGARLFQGALENIFCESGNKYRISVWRFAAFRPSKPRSGYWEQLRDSLRHKEELLLCILRHD
jgi:hypothetical protein